MSDLFADSNFHFQKAISGIVTLLKTPGMINVDLADIKLVLSNMGLSTVGYSSFKGVDRVGGAISKLLNSTGLKLFDLNSAKGCIVNITSDLKLSLGEFTEIGDSIEKLSSDQATIVVGTCVNEGKEGYLDITVIFTGLDELDFNLDEYRDDEEKFDLVTISKSIDFESHHVSAGLSILSYFNEFIHQKYNDTKAKIKIEQNGYTVRLIIEMPSGEVECIEKSLREYGEVVVGSKKANEVLSNELDVERLKMKLEMSALELRHNEKIFLMYKEKDKSNESRIEDLQNQVSELNRVIANSLAFAQNELSDQLQNANSIPRDLLELIKNNYSKDLTEDVKTLIEKEIINNQGSVNFVDDLKKMVDGVVYGANSGNALFSFIGAVVNSLPK